MGTVRTSKYLQMRRRDDGWATFHSLFGHLCHLDARGADFLHTLKTPMAEHSIVKDAADPASMRMFLEALKARSFLVDPDTDEYAVFEQDKRIRDVCCASGYLIQSLQLVVSNRCNFGCAHCFFLSHETSFRHQLQDAAENRDMTFDTARVAIEKTLALAQRHRTERIGVEFYGGEPTLNWSVIERVLRTFGPGGQSGQPRISYFITTNGSTITEEMAGLLKKHDVTVTVSYNFPTGPGEPDTAQSGRFRSVHRGLQILKDAGITLTLNKIILPDVFEQFDYPSYVDLALRYDARMLNLTLDLHASLFRDAEYSEKVITAIMSTYARGKTMGLYMNSYWNEAFAQLSGHRPHFLTSGFKYCPGTGCKLSVEPRGDLFVCKGSAGRIGHIDDLAAALASDKYREYALRVYRNAPECRGCQIEGFCSSGCMGSIERYYDQLAVADPSSCNLFIEITNRLIDQMVIEEFGENRLVSPAAKT